MLGLGDTPGIEAAGLDLPCSTDDVPPVPPVSGPFEMLTFIVSRALLDSWEDVRWPFESIRPVPVRIDIRAHGAPARAMIETMRALAGLDGASPAAGEHAMHEAADRVFDVLEAIADARGAPPAAPGGLLQVREAEDYMAARYRAALSTPDVARHAGLSVRGLQAAFLRHRGGGPMTFLKRVRFEAAHRELMSGRSGRSVTEVALDCGIPHLSRFAGAYRARFGRSPSEVLRDRALIFAQSFD